MALFHGTVIAAAAALVVACSPSTPPGSPLAEPSLPPFQRAFGPEFAATAPAGSPLRIDAAVLSHDHRTLSVAFLGGQAYSPANPCSTDYGAWARETGEALDIEVYQIGHPDRATFAPDMACTAEGHPYLFDIVLPAPFGGAAVNDLARGRLWIAPPDEVAELAPVPAGWRLTTISTVEAPPELDREYLPGPDAPGDRNRYLYLAQVFDGPTSHAVDLVVGTGSIRSQDVPIGRNGDTGFLANWRLGKDTLTLISGDGTLTLEAFLAMANAVAIPSP